MTEASARMLSRVAEQRASGEYVLQSARMVGDEDDHAIWRQSRLVWVTATIDVLGEVLPDGAGVLGEAWARPGGASGWKRGYEAELRAVAATLDALAGLAETVALSTEHVASPHPDAGFRARGDSRRALVCA